LILEKVSFLSSSNLQSLRRLLKRPELRFGTTAVAPLEHLGIDADVASALSVRAIVMPPLRECFDELVVLVNDTARSVEPGLRPSKRK
jgi:hypothetical protein